MGSERIQAIPSQVQPLEHVRPTSPTGSDTSSRSTETRSTETQSNSSSGGRPLTSLSRHARSLSQQRPTTPNESTPTEASDWGEAQPAEAGSRSPRFVAQDEMNQLFKIQYTQNLNQTQMAVSQPATQASDKEGDQLWGQLGVISTVQA